jgi:hypothetical protein
MCKAITTDRTLNFEGLTQECWKCTDGKDYIYTETCKTCNGKKRFLKGTRRYKCKTCNGDGYTMLQTPIEDGACRSCKGTRKIPLTAYDSMSQEDREWVFENLFNFEKPYTAPTSSFNEQYLGLGIVCGVTDYGRYKKMTPVEFKEEVRGFFMNRYNQYVTITNKKGELPTEILIKKSSDGWNAYPVFNKQNQ